MANSNNRNRKRKITKTKGAGKRTNNRWFKILLPERTHTTNEAGGKTEYRYPALCVTSSYDYLSTDLAGQRELDKKHSLKVIGGSVHELRSINRPVLVVKVGNSYSIADGKHMFNYLRHVGIPVEFNLVKVDTIVEAVKTMRLMNSNSKRWTLEQFVRSGATLDDNYKKLEATYKKTKEKYKVTLQVLATIMFCPQKFYTGYATQAIKDGTFQQNVAGEVVKRMLNAIENFYVTTGMTVYSYANKGLISFIYDKYDYFDKEKKFLKIVREEAKKRGVLSSSFGRTEDYKKFFEKCWAKL